MKKLLITTGIFYPDIGGPATYAKQLVDGLAGEYTSIVLAYSRVAPWMPKIFRQLMYALKVWRRAKQTDVIYALSTMSVGVSSALAARWTAKKFVIRVAGDRAWEDAVNAGKTHLLIDDYQKLQHRGLRHRLQVWVCRQAATIVVPSAYLKHLVEGWGIAPEKIKIIANAVDVVVEPLSKEEARTALGIHGKIILSAGRLVPWKGFRLLIKLMPQLLELNPFFRLVIVGDGPDREYLSVMIKNLNLQQKVLLAGKKSSQELQKYLRAAELFVLNTGYEGFSHQLLEAMAAGVPVITTSVGGNRELMRQGENGFMVKYNDEFNLLEAVKTVWHDAELREHFIKEGKKTVTQYTVGRMIEETKKVLNL